MEPEKTTEQEVTEAKAAVEEQEAHCMKHKAEVDTAQADFDAAEDAREQCLNALTKGTATAQDAEQATRNAQAARNVLDGFTARLERAEKALLSARARLSNAQHNHATLKGYQANAERRAKAARALEAYYEAVRHLAAAQAAFASASDEPLPSDMEMTRHFERGGYYVSVANQDDWHKHFTVARLTK